MIFGFLILRNENSLSNALNNLQNTDSNKNYLKEITVQTKILEKNMRARKNNKII